MELRGTRAKKEDEAPCEGSEQKICCESLLLVYLMRLPHLEEFGVMKPLGLEALGQLAPWPCL